MTQSNKVKKFCWKFLDFEFSDIQTQKLVSSRAGRLVPRFSFVSVISYFQLPACMRAGWIGLTQMNPDSERPLVFRG